MVKYSPEPLDTTGVQIPSKLQPLIEVLASNAHEIWAKRRISEGWRYGPCRDDKKKETPCLVPYEMLPESEKEFDRNLITETIRVILALNFDIYAKY